jgi:predicted enzyme related to lactoylglutathione lyase
MADVATAVVNRPVWVDLASQDASAARDFYGKVFDWQVEVNPDPQYGGYGIAKVGGKDVAGIGGTQSPDQPSAWALYIGTEDAERLAERIKAAGGSVVAPAFDVGDQGRMAVFQDPSGAFISAWQATRMGGFQSHGIGSFGWAELNARGLDKALPFYREVFGWEPHKVEAGGQPYTELHVGGEPIAGAMEMSPELPEQVPSNWLIYFGVADVDASHRRALEAGGREIVPPQDMPGGRFSIVSDPQGAGFGLLKLESSTV